MSHLNPKTRARLRRKKRIRKKLEGTSEKPRLCVFRSARHIYAQVIDDNASSVITATSTLSKDLRGDLPSSGKIGVAKEVGKFLAKKCLERDIKKVVFDRNGYLYHGRVKALADGAREGGLKF